MGLFDRPRTVMVIAGALILAIVVLIIVQRVTYDRSGAPVATDPRGPCAIARQALDAFDQGRQPPAEWIQDRAAAAEAVKKCDLR